MAVDAFLQFKTSGKNAVTLKGETKDKFMKAPPSGPPAFEISSWSFGATNPVNVSSQSGGGGAGKVNFDSFTVTKNIDAASPSLFQTACTGGHYDECVLWLRKAGGSNTKQSGQVYLKFNFKLVMIENIEWAHGDPAPTESIKFQYGALSVVYYPQNQDGSIARGKKKNATWDRVTNAQAFDAGFGNTTPETEANPGDN
jgi:type VI secretion system secreted protein Hcp